MEAFVCHAITLLEGLEEVYEESPSSALLHSELLLRDTAVMLDLDQMDCLEEFFAELNVMVSSLMELELDCYHFQNFQRRPGRPKIYIPEEQLVFLLEQNFKIKDIAHMFLVSPRTISRRIELYGLQAVSAYTDLSDNQLDDLADIFLNHNPNGGFKSFEGFLRSQGFKIQRSRIRHCLWRVDPRGVLDRQKRLLHRRTYSVAMPNSLWHIDTNHKLIRWRFIIFGGIDGFSRLPVFLKVSGDNKAATMLRFFLEGVTTYGLPSRVRCDKGRENTDVSRYMIEKRGPGRGSCITGRSVHNQRIERFWRDMYQGCTSLFYNLFYYMEDNNMLNPDSEQDLFCLHYIYLPRIQHHLNLFREGYAHHRLRTENNMSPLQLWISGLSVLNNDDSAASDSLNYEMVSVFGSKYSELILIFNL